MKKFLVSARRCESGATAIEYALIAGVMAVALVAGASNIGINISAVMDLVADAL